MTPQTGYEVKVTVADTWYAGRPGHGCGLRLFYDSDGDDSAADIPAADTQACFIMTCTVGDTPTWSRESRVRPPAWDIVEGSCVQPALTGGSGDFYFNFMPGKVATEATDWDVYVVVTDDSALNRQLL